MNLNDTEKKELKKWAFQQAEAIARHNASVLIPNAQQTPIDYDKIEEIAKRLFEWVTD